MIRGAYRPSVHPTGSVHTCFFESDVVAREFGEFAVRKEPGGGGVNLVREPFRRAPIAVVLCRHNRFTQVNDRRRTADGAGRPEPRARLTIKSRSGVVILGNRQETDFPTCQPEIGGELSDAEILDSDNLRKVRDLFPKRTRKVEFKGFGIFQQR